MNQDGLVQRTDQRENRVEIPVGMVVTDRHIVFAALGRDDSDAGQLAYKELAGIDVQDGVLELTTVDGICWCFPLVEKHSEPVDIALRHLRWIGEVRHRVVSAKDDIERFAQQIHTLAADREWEEAERTYRERRRELDELFCLIQCTTPLDESVLAPEFTSIERALETAHSRLYIRRSKSSLQLGQQLVLNEDYGQARKVLTEAREYYEQAQWYREEIERGDAFQFGPQRELALDLEELRWAIESTAAEPLQQAHEAKIEAETANDMERAIECWETAFRRYHGVLTLEWGEQRPSTGDPETARDEIQGAAERLIDLHERAARKRWNEGAQLEADGQETQATQTCAEALEHLERVTELAADFDQERAAEFEHKLEKMFETFLEMRGTFPRGTNEYPAPHSGDEPETQDTAEPPQTTGRVDDSGNRRTRVPSMRDISKMDIHDEITLHLGGRGDSLTSETDSPDSTDGSNADRYAEGRPQSNGTERT